MRYNYSDYYPLDYQELIFRELPLPFDEHSIIYIEKEYNREINVFIQSHYDQICECFEKRGFTFYYFPFLPQEVTKEVINRYAGTKGQELEGVGLRSDFMLNFLEYYEISPDDDTTDEGSIPTETYEETPTIFPSLLFCDRPPKRQIMKPPVVTRYCFKRFELTLSSRYYATPDLSGVLNIIEDYIRNCDEYEENKHTLYSDIDEDFSEIEDDTDLDEINGYDDEALLQKTIKDVEKNIQLLNEIEGRTVYTYSLKETRNVSPRKLIITKKYDIIVDGVAKINIGPQFKALYLLLLNHPEGITHNDLSGYVDEVDEWYECVKSTYESGNKDKLVEFLGRSYSSLSRIRSTIISILREELGNFYAPQKSKNGLLTIKLPREMVVWEGKKIKQYEKTPDYKHDKHWY